MLDLADLSAGEQSVERCAHGVASGRSGPRDDGGNRSRGGHEAVVLARHVTVRTHDENGRCGGRRREYEQARPEQCEADQAHQLDATLGPAGRRDLQSLLQTQKDHLIVSTPDACPSLRSSSRSWPARWAWSPAGETAGTTPTRSSRRRSAATRRSRAARSSSSSACRRRAPHRSAARSPSPCRVRSRARAEEAAEVRLRPHPGGRRPERSPPAPSRPATRASSSFQGRTTRSPTRSSTSSSRATSRSQSQSKTNDQTSIVLVARDRPEQVAQGPQERGRDRRSAATTRSRSPPASTWPSCSTTSTGARARRAALGVQRRTSSPRRSSPTSSARGRGRDQGRARSTSTPARTTRSCAA